MTIPWHRAKAFAMRHRGKLIDGSTVLLFAVLAIFYAWEIDIFVADGTATRAQRGVELDEVMAISALICGGLAVFALRRLKEARREADRRMVAEREARTLALHDALTGLPNRRHFTETLAAAVAAPPRSGGSHILVMMDLNGFKRINDLFGHQAGDEVLVQVGGRLSRAVRDGDLVARLGGDEFAVLAMHAGGAEAATGLAMRIMDALAPPVAAAGGEHRVGVAIGISLTPQDGADPAELIRKADIALYRAKAEKDRSPSAMRFFELTMDAQVRERDQLERELRDAVRDRAIVPFYQPLVTLDGGGVTAFEALARWTSPTLGPVSPDRFIAVAEDAGLIGHLTEQLLERACLDALAWPPHIDLAFNVSGAVLQDGMFGLKVLQVLSHTRFPPARLELEITESALVHDLEAARTTLGQLRVIGVRIALDDFGTGYSSLYHLRTFKPDKIKIDRSFIDGMQSDPDDAAIVQALIGLGQGLGATVTAEGVETAGQQDFLRARGCGQGQGHLFSCAVDAGEALALVAPPPPAEHALRA